jgi:hypothetical protein
MPVHESVGQTVGQTKVAARRPTAVLVTLVVLFAAAVVSAATWIRYGEQLAELGGGFADLVVLAQFLTGLYGVLAGAVLLGGVLVAARPRLGTPLLLAVLALTVPGHALILFIVIHDCGQILEGGVRVIGDRSVALAAVQLTAAVAAALATGAALIALIRRR